MQDRNWPGIATAVAILWVVSTIVWLGIAGPIWRASASTSPEPWIGFAGSALGAGVTLLAAVIAGFAAYRTIVPMQHQLAELVKQNNFDHYDRLRSRVAHLVLFNNLVQSVTANLEVMDRSFALTGLGASEGRETAFLRLEESVIRLNGDRAQVWGDQNAQSLITHFTDQTLQATTVARGSLPGGDRSNFTLTKWQEAKATAFQAGVAVYFRIDLEIKRLSVEISRLEPKVLGIDPFPQLWEGDYPGPQVMAEHYAAHVAEAALKAAAEHP